MTNQRMAEFLKASVVEHDMTVAEYLDELLIHTWLGQGHPKYGWTGSSDWRYDLYRVLRDMGIVTYDDAMGLDDDQEKSADQFILDAIRQRSLTTSE